MFYRDKLPKFHFNPRSHEGSDQAEPMATISETDFNPRSHEGSDKVFVRIYQKTRISIHAPTRGATFT